MTATVVLANVSVTHIILQGSLGNAVYDGLATYHVKSESIDFNFEYQFKSALNIEIAVANGAAILKRQLDDLSAVTQNIRSVLSSP